MNNFKKKETKKVKYLFGGIIDNGLTKLPLDISNLSKGKYLINIQTEKGFKQIPFIKL